ncbi:hypothetical protein BYZ73_20635 [Rhodovulum viride]|uniref:Uncharacterized protein n=1 Tax=Rhodovulum viride TaxID=1231134 RepID=A0ABX9DDJ5_9RHOB|nr:hypothetical protein [Rhodovulum viride]RAP39423.1 hypothetical protein BYZ73_20635 [Rhodovulum viride]
MAFQFSTAARNAALDAIETATGSGPTLELRSGAAPADCGAADTGTLLASMTLPGDWLAAAANGTKAMLGTWQDSAAAAAGTVGHFRVRQGAACHIQGSVTATGGGGDMTLDNPALASGQQVTVTAFTLSAGGE